MFHRTALLCFIALLGMSSALPQANFSTSLHATRNGKNYWYGKANGGFENFTNVPVENVGCVACHGPKDANGNTYATPYTPGCSDCHPTATAGFTKDSIKVDQCLTCHSRQKTESVTLGYSDVHRSAGFKCWDCHTSNDMHGDGTAYSSMLEPEAISIDCEDCHNSGGGTLPDHSSYDPHGGKLHCTTCHAKTVTSCYNCHFESQVETQLKRAKQTLHGFVILANRDEDGKVYPMTFQSLTYQGTAFAAFGPFTSHTITEEGRTCTDCHANFGGTNAAIAQYNAGGQIKFATWNEADSTLSVLQGIVPMPADYQRSFRMDFITYNGSTSDPVAPSKNWSKIGKDTWDGHQMFFAKPLTKAQMAKIGMDTTLTTGVEDLTGEVPATFSLEQNYPNPFNPETKIRVRIAAAGQVRLAVYDVTGREVAVLMNERREAGVYDVAFNASSLVSGVYLYRLSAGDFTAARKMVVLK